MAAPRLSDAQKQELVDRFRAGAGTQELAAAYGCSPNTVIRVVKAAIEPSLYEELKRQRGRRAGQAPEPESAAPDATDPATEPLPEPEPEPEPGAPSADLAAPASERATPSPSAAAESVVAPAQDDEPAARDHDAARALAIDDADDFDDVDAEDEDEDDDDGDGDDPDDGDGSGFSDQTFFEVPISLGEPLDQPVTTARPWCADEIPSSAYMLVDKTVELQALPLAEIPELGRLEAAEQALQALVLYSNPRQAKRHCGRTQRVIKIPDVGVLERRAAYLVRQGIRRVVVEGALYALPEG